jgi:glycosyltransferase involved in cell wall biosynthesis
MAPRLSVLIATIGRRNNRFIELIEYLTNMAKDFDVEIIAYWNNGEEPIGKIRQSLVENAVGDYVCFIDDDDWVPDYYLAEIFKAMGKDYIGFQVELFEKDKQLKPVFHSIRYGVWHDDEKGFYRGVTHLNPIRRQLALLGDFANQGIGEDANWARSLRSLVQTENYIDKIMYYYFHDADLTTFGGAEQPKQEYIRPDFEHPKFRYHPKSKQKGEM